MSKAGGSAARFRVRGRGRLDRVPVERLAQ
jgi:hypothetical protein